MSYINVNPNPNGVYVGDCVIRALSIALEKTWHEIYIELSIQGLVLCDMPSSNRVWGEYLKTQGYHRYVIPDTCPQCYTIKEFCKEHPEGIYLLGTGTHVVAVIDGNYYDSWDSGDELPIYYWKKESEE